MADAMFLEDNEALEYLRIFPLGGKHYASQDHDEVVLFKHTSEGIERFTFNPSTKSIKHCLVDHNGHWKNTPIQIGKGVKIFLAQADSKFVFEDGEFRMVRYPRLELKRYMERHAFSTSDGIDLLAPFTFLFKLFGLFK